MTDAAPDTTPSDAIVTIPNLVSLVRLAAVPYFLWLLLGQDRPAAAGFLLLAIGATDWIDGTLARRLGQVSVLGQKLDPVADRVAIVAAIIVPLLIREVMMTIVAFVLLTRYGETLEVRYLGKVATFLIYGSIPSFYVAAGDILPSLFSALGWIAGVIGLLLYWWVAVRYLQDAGTKLRQLRQSNR